jgi:hypothetical protein
MPFITIAERVGIEKGFEIGFAIGFEIGRKQGLLEGLLQGIETCLELKFGAEGLELMPELREIPDHELLRVVLRAIPAAASPEALRRVWTRGRRSKKRGLA